MDKNRMDEWSRGLIFAVAVAVKDGWIESKGAVKEGWRDGAIADP